MSDEKIKENYFLDESDYRPEFLTEIFLESLKKEKHLRFKLTCKQNELKRMKIAFKERGIPLPEPPEPKTP